MCSQFGEEAFRLAVGWRDRQTEQSPRARCGEQFESSCAERAEVCGFFHVLRLHWYNIHVETEVVMCFPSSLDLLDIELELWSVKGVSDWERLSTAAVRGSCWVKAPRSVQWCKSLGLSSRSGGKLPQCPGVLSRLSGWLWCEPFIRAGILTSGSISHRHW